MRVKEEYDQEMSPPPKEKDNKPQSPKEECKEEDEDDEDYSTPPSAISQMDTLCIEHDEGQERCLGKKLYRKKMKNDARKDNEQVQTKIPKKRSRFPRQQKQPPVRHQRHHSSTPGRNRWRVVVDKDPPQIHEIQAKVCYRTHALVTNSTSISAN